MAVGAEELVTLTSNQLIITAIEVVLVLIAVGAAFWAAWEARKAAKATAETVDVARETAQQQLRAYVTVDLITIDDIENFYSYKIVWKNTGGSPAIRVITYSNWCAETGRELPADFDYPLGDGLSKNDAAGLGAGQSIESWPVFIPRDTIQRAQRDIQNIYVWGAAEYSDVFTKTTRRRTEFCYHFTVEITSNNKIGIGQRIYGPHNGIDETCHHKPQPG